jgi:OOP family OmpA-OmpF porin
MKKAQLLVAFLSFALAAALSAGAAVVTVTWIERSATHDVAFAMQEAGHDWAEVTADGLQVLLSGTAPDEARRFQAITIAGQHVASDRLVDQIDVTDPEGLEPPRFSVEMLRNGDGISLIGLVPGATERIELLAAVADLAADTRVTDMLETAEHPQPDGWERSIAYAVWALQRLPRSKISASPGMVQITAISDSPEEKRRIEGELSRAAPEGVIVDLAISAPRPVVTPFALRFTLDAEGARFDACTADTEAAKSRIIRAATQAGLTGKIDCIVGLGTPSPRWGEAAALAIGALEELGGGTVTISDADLGLVAPASVTRTAFDTIVHKLESALPEVFSVHAVLLEPEPAAGETAPAAVAEFAATRSPEGAVVLRGRMGDARAKTAMASLAQALFGAGAVTDTTRIEADMPDGWAVRVLAGLEALSLLDNGSLVVRPDLLELRGVTGAQSASADISALLATRLGDAEDIRLSVRYDERLDPLAALPTPAECAARIGGVLETRQITFDPGASTIDAAALPVVDQIAEILKGCGAVAMEIGGHTDSQGRETMNLALSQSRAEAVLDALLTRAVLDAELSAKGYGETQPIADNGTEEGRERNRRIEFRLLPDPAAETAEGAPPPVVVENAAPATPPPPRPEAVREGDPVDGAPLDGAILEGSGDSLDGGDGTEDDEAEAGPPAAAD